MQPDRLRERSAVWLRVDVCACARALCVCVFVFVYVGKATVALVVKKSFDIERYSVSMGAWSIRAHPAALM